MGTINDALQKVVNIYPDNIFLYEGSKSLTYKQLNEVTDRLASAFLEEGLERGDHIGGPCFKSNGMAHFVFCSS
ncbi:AMP-binding protein [Viridibacillus sp. FSL E2-0187]|uniref:AMP-binding protein n=1 Tax=Viridibacillus sp. FSL E2-0187 TaxID=2921362 RepID=UPI004047F581